MTTMMTTTTSKAPADGRGNLPRNADFPHLLRVVHWDGLFTAACPCGRDTSWDAFMIEPLCDCSVVIG